VRLREETGKLHINLNLNEYYGLSIFLAAGDAECTEQANVLAPWSLNINSVLDTSGSCL
jgi:hypothetical protein